MNKCTLFFFKTNHPLIRRLSSDLSIEQVLTISMKSTGGWTRGRGTGESERTQWLLSISTCADINGAMQKLRRTTFMTSDQHKDVTKDRKARDDKDSCMLSLGFFRKVIHVSPTCLGETLRPVTKLMLSG